MTNEIVDKILAVLDSSTLLGAAYDCMSDAAKAKLRKKLEAIDDPSSSQDKISV